MHGYGEFTWKDGKKYIGNYTNDRKEGFGIYYWSNPVRVYIGFWKNGKQDGFGKYINNKGTKYGVWENGERKAWFNNAFEALNAKGNEKYKKLFDYELEDIEKFLD